MKRKDNAIKTATYIVPLIVIFSSLLLVVFVTLSLIGVFNPRQIKLVIRTADASKMYDGEPLSSLEYEINYGKVLSNHTITALPSAEITKVGTTENVIDFLIEDETGADVMHLYDIDIEYGTLEITPKQVSISTPSIFKNYDTLPLESSKFNIIRSDFVEGDSLVVTQPFSESRVGEYENKIGFSIVDKKGNDVTDQYEINWKYGKAEVRARVLTISTGSQDSLYTGKPVSNKTWTHESGNLFAGDVLKVVCNAAITEVGSIKNIPDVIVLNQNGVDVTENYEFNFIAGTLEVKPIPIVVQTGSTTKIYDGKTLSNTNWSIKGGGLIKGDVITPASYPTLDKVGAIPNDVVFSVKDSKGVDVSSRYEITCIGGTLEVQPRQISVMTLSARKTYDGEALMCNEFKIIDGSLCSTHKASFVGSQQTEIGYSQNLPTKFEILETTANGTTSDVSLNYLITYTYGTLTVIN